MHELFCFYRLERLLSWEPKDGCRHVRSGMAVELRLGKTEEWKMRLFKCSQCQNTVFFENVRCLNCMATLAYLPDRRDMSAITPEASDAGEHLYRAWFHGASGGVYRLCNNSMMGVCNWAIPAADPDPFCPSCRLNDIVPNLAAPGALDAWRGLEIAKRRLYYTLEKLRLPVESRASSPENGLVFSFKQDTPDEKVFTGHADGLITINIAEADDPLREKFKKNLGERYRTLLGHFRHEIGHYYWDRLVKGTVWLSGFREVFGDERINYEEALSLHYAQGAPPDWATSFLTAYASAHPWEDWAETWAHYLHMVDALEMAGCYGLTLMPHKAAAQPVQTS